MSSLLMLACLFLLPALLTWILTRLLLRSEAMQRRQALVIAVPLGALLPLLPFAITVGRAGNIDNPVPIAIAATLMAAVVIALCVCLPVGLAASRGR
ncbi:hypothetical protein [Novosphingobium sp. TH158]|uniref:hypothetical protein n=1 Tax=Novosphingobium sp. TH158 TaxID=2067455 RepID=UPI000C7E6B2A|nr:hypothetical protein [Novosphingobium sp. TH158]PLK24266.1 hypothetical protein C0V78_13405 [Novosphingobium sp. TH158]